MWLMSLVLSRNFRVKGRALWPAGLAISRAFRVKGGTMVAPNCIYDSGWQNEWRSSKLASFFIVQVTRSVNSRSISRE
jgi:hypothetical protein